MDTTKLDKLIVDHLNDLDSAGKRIAEIQQRLWRDIAEAVESWTKSKAWTGSFSVDDEIWVAPKQWIVEDDFEARFYLDWGPDDTGEGVGEEPCLELSRLCGVAGGQLCLWFNQKVAGAKIWKPIARAAGEKVSKFGFLLSDKSQFYLVCTLEQSVVAAALEDDDLGVALTPLTEALQRAGQAEHLFSSILDKARKA